MASNRKKTKIISQKQFSLYLAIMLIVGILGYIGFRHFSSHATGNVTWQGYKVNVNTNPYNPSGPYSSTPIIFDSTYAHPENPWYQVSGAGQTHTMGPQSAPSGWSYVGYKACENSNTSCNANTAPLQPGTFVSQANQNSDGQVWNVWFFFADSSPPTIPHLNGAVAGTSQINLSWNASADNYSGIAGYDVYRNGNKIASVGSLSYASAGLAAGTTYSYYIKARDGVQNQSGPSNTISLTTTRPPNQPAGGSSGGGGTTKPKPSSGSSSSTPTVQQGSGGNLTTPSNLTANSNVVGVVLNWSLSSGGSGDVSYQIDRSTNGTDWQSITSSVFGSSYADTTASYNTSYHYRVRAGDSTGAFSDYALASVTTGSYSATPGNTISSDDGNVTATIADGAIDPDSACAIVNQSETQPLSDPKATIIQGPYLLVCRTASGDVINDFKGNVAVVVKLTSESLKGHGNFKVTVNQTDSASWQTTDSKFNSKNKTLSFTLTKATTFAVTGTKKADYARYAIIVLAILLIGTILFILIRKKDTLVEWFYRR